MPQSSNTMFSFFGCVLDAPLEEKSPLEWLVLKQSNLNQSKEFFNASIIHDKDIKEDGSLKRCHLHFIVELPKPKTKKSFLDFMTEWLELPNKNLLSCDGTKTTITKICQYLTHKNDLDKFQYELSEISSNNIDKFLSYYNLLSTDDVQNVFIKLATAPLAKFEDLVRNIGLERANKYRASFNQIHSDLQRREPTTIKDLFDFSRELFKIAYPLLTKEQQEDFVLKWGDIQNKIFELYGFNLNE